jgi:uncharacterized membrane-anchored protein
MNIVFVCVVEAMAASSDLYLLRKFTQNKRSGEKFRSKMIKDMWLVYIAIWITICADVAAKVRNSLAFRLLS